MFWGLIFSFAFAHAEPEIRVLLTKNQTSVEVSALDLAIYSHKELIQKDSGQNKWIFQEDERGLTITSAHHKPIRVTPFSKIDLVSSNIRYKLEKYKSLHLVKIPKAGLAVVTSVPLEEYVTGVVGSEMPVHWHEEALKAQAVAARSYGLFMKWNNRSRYYDVEGTINDQVFNPMDNQRVIGIVKKTAAEVLYTPVGEVLQAFYHSDCGGMTDSASGVWSLENTKVEAHSRCQLNQSSMWRHSISLATLETRLQNYFRLQREDHLRALRVDERLPSSRVRTLTAQFETGPQSILGNELRKIVGFTKIKSAFFELNRQGSWVDFLGRGFGHGVGMCQMGSKHFAQNGWGYKNILKYYFPLASVGQLESGSPMVPVSWQTSSGFEQRKKSQRRL